MSRGCAPLVHGPGDAVSSRPISTPAVAVAVLVLKHDLSAHIGSRCHLCPVVRALCRPLALLLRLVAACAA